MYVGIGSPYIPRNPFSAEQADQLPQQGKDEARDERKENEGLMTLLRLHVFLCPLLQFLWCRVFVGWNPCRINGTYLNDNDNVGMRSLKHQPTIEHLAVVE